MSILVECPVCHSRHKKKNARRFFRCCGLTFMINEGTIVARGASREIMGAIDVTKMAKMAKGIITKKEEQNE